MMMEPELRTEVYYREDVRALLLALMEANGGLLNQLQGQQIAAYRAGFTAALQAVATAFDVSLERGPQIRLHVEQRLLNRYCGE